jgi:hypothetical protein
MDRSTGFCRDAYLPHKSQPVENLADMIRLCRPRYLAVVQRKPGALRNGAPFTELPEAFKRLQQHLLRKPGGDREMVEILALVLQHDEQAVLAAVEMALEAGVPTKVHILNLLHRLVDGRPLAAPVVDAPQALSLAKEPQANVERYDALRQAREVRHAS